MGDVHGAFVGCLLLTRTNRDSGGMMNNNSRGRRDFLKRAGVMGAMGSLGTIMASLPEGAISLGGAIREEALTAQEQEAPKNHIKFGVCGMSHDHIYGMIGAVQRGGGEMVACWAGEEDKIALFKKRFPNVKMVATQDEIINDPSVQLVLSSQIANERAPLGVRAMKHGKDFLSDKPGMTTLAQL